jgi:hypothetical protein
MSGKKNEQNTTNEFGDSDLVARQKKLDKAGFKDPTDPKNFTGKARDKVIQQNAKQKADEFRSNTRQPRNVKDSTKKKLERKKRKETRGSTII